MQATALCDQRGIEIRVKLNVGFRFQGWLQGLQCWDGRTAPSEQVSLSPGWRSCQALGEAASCYSASHQGAGVEGIDGQQQAGQASSSRVEIFSVCEQAAQSDQGKNQRSNG